MTTQQAVSQKNPSRRKTKIVATIGPASSSPERIADLIRAGANVFRLNFSHGTHEEHKLVYDRIREQSKLLNVPVAILQDLSGPKIRITEIDPDTKPLPDSGEVTLKKAKGEKSNETCIYVEGLDPARILEPGQPVLLADGLMVLHAVEVTADGVRCQINKGGKLRSRVGIAFPDSIVDLPAATDKDLVDLAWGIKQGVDFVAISFVQNALDITRLREEMVKLGGKAAIIAKIERKLAVQNIEEILDVTDGIMVARGDLGLEYPLERLPLLQKNLIERSNSVGLPVIVATQMLHSMVNAVRPTRAEVSDVAAAVMSGADAVMLSEETAIGNHPIESVTYLSNIALEAEKSFEFEEYKLRLRDADKLAVPDAVAYAASAAAVKVGANAIIACTETGTSARLVAKYRPQQPLYGASRSESTLRRMCMNWGVHPISLKVTHDHPNEIESAMEVVQRLESLPNGARAVVTGGLAVGAPGSTSVLEIREMKYL